MDSIQINYKKLRKSRKKQNLSIAEVSSKTGIPAATLQKYESGIIKKIPLETLKKVCNIYKTDYRLYFWWVEFTSLSDIIFYFLIYPNLFKESELFKILGIEEYFKIDNKSDIFSCLYNNLSEEEKENYSRFKMIAENVLKSDKFFKKDELEKENKSLFSFFYANKIKSEKNVNLEILKEF